MLILDLFRQRPGEAPPTCKTHVWHSNKGLATFYHVSQRNGLCLTCALDGTCTTHSFLVGTCELDMSTMHPFTTLTWAQPLISFWSHFSMCNQAITDVIPSLINLHTQQMQKCNMLSRMQLLIVQLASPAAPDIIPKPFHFGTSLETYNSICGIKAMIYASHKNPVIYVNFIYTVFSIGLQLTRMWFGEKWGWA